MSAPTIKKATDGMTAEQLKAYDDFYGNVDRLKKEWMLCNQQYQQYLALGEIDVDFPARMSMRKISDYWKNRRNALEASLPDDLISQVKG